MNLDMIRPVSDFNNDLNEVSRLVHENNHAMILTTDGTPDIVVLTADSYQQNQEDMEIYLKLKEAELNSTNEHRRASTKDFLMSLRSEIKETYNV